MNDVLNRHDSVRALFDNRWLYLFALDEKGQMAWRYQGSLEWSAVEETDKMPIKMVAAG